MCQRSVSDGDGPIDIARVRARATPMAYSTLHYKVLDAPRFARARRPNRGRRGGRRAPSRRPPVPLPPPAARRPRSPREAQRHDGRPRLARSVELDPAVFAEPATEGRLQVPPPFTV